MEASRALVLCNDLLGIRPDGQVPHSRRHRVLNTGNSTSLFGAAHQSTYHQIIICFGDLSQGIPFIKIISCWLTNYCCRSTWLEICTDSLEDWKEFFNLCAMRFRDSISFKDSHPDPVKRKRYVEEYFKDFHQKMLSGGRAGLGCVKKMNCAGVSHIAYGMCVSYNREPSCLNQRPSLCDIDEAGAKTDLEESRWLEEAVHQNLREMAKQLHFNTMYGDYHASADAHEGLGLSKRYGHALLEELYQDGVRRGILDKTMRTIPYGIVDDPKTLRIQTGAYRGSVIAHLHQDNDANCLYVRGNKKVINAGSSCVVVVVYPLKKFPAELVNDIRRRFSLFSNL